MQTSDTVDKRRSLPVFAEDVGHDLVAAGWAALYDDGDANAEYMDHIRSAADSAAYQPEGLYAEPCGKPKVFGDDDGNGVADWDEDGDDNLNVSEGGLPDGALTGGFCARKRWC